MQKVLATAIGAMLPASCAALAWAVQQPKARGR